MRFLLLFLFLISCSKSENDQEEITLFQGERMKMPYSVTIGANLNSKKRNLVQRIIDEVFEETDLLYNNWNPRSEISRLNAHSGQKSILISTNLYALFEKVQKVYELSEKKFDPTILPLLNLYRSYWEKGKTPLSWQIEKAKKSVGWDQIQLEKGTFYKKSSEIEIDLCGIAKGHAIDLIAEKLLKNGFLDFMVEWSGDIRAHGTHPSKRPWRIKIFGTNENYTFPLDNLSIATSGDFVFNWQVGDQKYHHILNSRTKKPLTIDNDSIASVSCIAPECALADALATSAMACESVQEARDWADRVVKERPNTCFWIISHKQKEN